jgi:repressor LexA
MSNSKLNETRITTGDRIKQVMDERGLKQADIIRLCQPYMLRYGIRLGRNDLSQYLSGRCVPGQQKLFLLGKALQVSEAWLMGFDVDPSPRVERDSLDLVSNVVRRIQTKKFPMIGEIACGSPIVAHREYETYVEGSVNIDADFCLTAKGDSMINARIFDGDVVFIRQQPTVNNGEIAAVIIDNDVTLKRVYLYNNRIELRPENPTYPVLNYEGEQLDTIRIIGKAVAFQSYVR